MEGLIDTRLWAPVWYIGYVASSFACIQPGVRVLSWAIMVRLLEQATGWRRLMPLWRSGWLVCLLFAACGPTGSEQVDGEAPGDAGVHLGDLALPDGEIRAATQVSVHVEPAAKITPVVNAIKAAKSSISLTIYILTHDDVIDELIAAQARGVQVRVILEHYPMGGAQLNTEAYNRLSAGHVGVKWASSQFNFTHSKSMIIDGSTLWSMTMNLAQTAPGNREYLLVDTDPLDVSEATAVFEADWTGAAVPALQSLVVSPINARVRLAELINHAKQEIAIEWEELSDQGIGDLLTARLQAGVVVKLIVPSDMGPNTRSRLGLLKYANAQVRTLDDPYIHAKMILVDQQLGFIGSVNATSNSLDNNRELGVVWRNAQVAQTAASTFAADFAKGAAF